MDFRKRVTDGRTDGRTDRPSYRDARTHLKMIGSGVGGIELMIDGFSKKGNGRTVSRYLARALNDSVYSILIERFSLSLVYSKRSTLLVSSLSLSFVALKTRFKSIV